MSAAIKRPGISDAAIAAAQIRQVDGSEARELCGLQQPGMWIPFFGRDGRPVMDLGKPYGRLRLSNPDGPKKYHQQAETGVHVYFPPIAKQSDDLYLVEGEFKALAMADHGLFAVGVSGFYGPLVKGEIHPHLGALLLDAKPRRILFCGDQDTALNIQFSDAALKLATALQREIVLPRIPLDAPAKGFDDLRECLGTGFTEFWNRCMARAVTIDSEWSKGAVAVELLRIESESLKAGKFGMPKAKAMKRVTEIASACEAYDYDDLASLLEQAKVTSRSTLAKAVKALRTDVIKQPTLDEIHMIGAQFFFDGKVYYRKTECEPEEFAAMAREDATLKMDELGAIRKAPEGRTRTPAEDCLLYIQKAKRVEFAGPLCGRTMGLYQESGRKFLATRSPEFIKGSADPDPGRSTLFKFFSDLLGVGRDPHGETQFELFLGWLQTGRRALMNPDIHLPGQLLGLFGARDCGKSLAQTLITKCLGGREADASTWLQGRTDFNAQLWGAEHLTLSDANLEDCPQTKQAFRDAIKGIVANPTYPLARKYRDEVSLRPIWRLSISANDDARSAGVIPSPTADPSLADKVVYLQCYPPPAPYPSEGPNSRAEFWKSLVDDLPNFLGFVDALELDEELTKPRFGIIEFIHPSIGELLDSANPDREFLEYLEDFMSKWPMGWEGRSKDLFEDLQKHNPETSRLVRNQLVLTHVLRRASELPDWGKRIQKQTRRFGDKGRQTLYWLIDKPLPHRSPTLVSGF